MTQKELIEFCKANDPNFNKDASFKVLEPMWSIPKGVGGLGITESEFKNGFYVEIDTKGRKGFEHLNGRTFYFREKVDPTKYLAKLYHSTYRKYYVPLDSLRGWGKEITKQVIEEPKLCDTYKEKNLVFAEVSDLQVIQEVENPVEEFPIVKTQGKTTYSKRNTFIVVGKSNYNDNVILQDLDGKEIAHSKESFSDLVDLMIEARKDLLK
jgi:hypothetical protein